jgi:23S rRNA (guanosine2251-2'-O)-methyltransferase
MFVYGIRPVFEILYSPLIVKKVWVEQGKIQDRRDELQKLCLDKNVELLEKSGRFLQKLCGQEFHQGLVASYIPKHSELCFESNTPPRTGAWLCLYLDRIQDSHNFGAIVRSAEFFAVDQIFYPEHNASPWNEVAMKASVGAGAHNAPFKVSSVTSFFEQVQSREFQIVGALPDTASIKMEDFNFKKDTLLLLGHEGEGVSEKLKKYCTAFVQIPRVGQIESLNVSVSAGVLLYEIQRQRKSFV